MSAVEKVAANAAFSASSSIGQSPRKPSHILSRVTTNPSPAENDLAHHSSDGNSEFEEALKNIKALNGQSRYGDNEVEEKSTSIDRSSTEKAISIDRSSTEKAISIDRSTDKAISPNRSAIDNVASLDRLPTSKAISIDRSADKVTSLDRSATDKVISVDRSATEKVASVHKSSTEKATSLNRSSTEKATSLDWSSTEKATSLDWSSTEKATSLDRSSTEKAASLDWSSTEKATSLDRSSTEKATSLDWLSTEKTTSLDRSSTEKATSLDKAPTEKATSLDKAPTEKATSLDRSSTEKATSLDRSSTETATSLDRSSTETATSLDRSSTEKAASLDWSSTEKATSLDKAPTEKVTSLDRSSTEKVTSLDRSSTEKATSLGWLSTEKATSLDWLSTEKATSLDWPSTEKATSLDRSSTEKSASLERSSIEKAPTEKVTSLDRAPTEKTTSLDRSPTEKTTSLDGASTEKTTSLDRASTEKTTSLDRSSTEKATSLDRSLTEKATSVNRLSTNKNVFDMKLEPNETNTLDSISSNFSKKCESQLNPESVAKLKTNLGSFFSKTPSDSIAIKSSKFFTEDADSDSNEASCDKADLLKDSGKDKSNHLNPRNNIATKDNGDNDKMETDVSHLGSEAKIRDSFKTFFQNSSNSFSKMLLKTKDDTNVQSVTSTSDSQTSSKLNKTSSVRGNLFENFESLASPETEEKEEPMDTSKPNEETTTCPVKSNGQAESKLWSPINSDELKKCDNKSALKAESSEEPRESKSNNICDKGSPVLLSNHSLPPGDKLNSVQLDPSPHSSPVSAKHSESDISPLKLTDDCSGVDSEGEITRKRRADSDGNLSDDDGDSAPLKRSRLDDMIGNLGSRIGITLDSIPFVDELEESSKDSDFSEKPSEDIASTDDDDDDDADKPTDLGKKIIKMTEKELSEIVKREVEKILNASEINLVSLQQKIDDLQTANESWKTRAKELHKQMLEQTVVLQKSEKRKMAAAAALKLHSTRHVGVQVSMQAEDGKVLPSPNPPRSGLINNQISSPPVSKFQSPTVKSLLDASRSTNPNQVSSSPAVVYQSSPGLFVVSSPTATTTTTTTPAHSLLAKPIPGHVSTPQAPPRTAGSVKVIDLTGDDESQLNGQPSNKNLVHVAAAAASTGIIPQHVVRQVTPVQQQPQVPPGTSFLLSTPAGTQIISPTVTQGMPGARPGVCQYVLTTPNIRPGSLVTVVPTPGTQNPTLRPPIVSSTIANASSLPQLRPAIPSSSVASVDLTKGIRPPPPLQSAPMSQRVVSTILSSSPSQSLASVAKHPAPLPLTPSNNVPSQGLKSPPPKPGLRITRVAQGIVLSWNMTLTDTHAEISNYQLYAYQEGSAPPSTSLWKKVGDIKALPLPMACTLTQFHEGNKYHFAVRAVDTHSRVGPFSDPNTINLSVGGK